MYRNTKTNEFAELLEEDEKYKTVLLKTENGKTISMTVATFHRDWKEIKGE